MRQYWQRTARKLGWDRNPLRRGIDRAEAVVLAALAAAVVIAAPLAIFAGHLAGAAALREQHAERGRYHVPAVLLQSAGQAVITAGEMDLAWVRARWTERGGQHRAGLVPVAPTAEAGQRVEIWLTPAGQPTSAPLSAADVRSRVRYAMSLAVTGWLAVIGLVAVSVRVLADRRRMAGWQREWDAAGPHWSHHG